MPRGGIVVAFVGADGSGKSSLVKKSADWFAWKADVFPIYFGSGEGKSSIARWPLRIAYKTTVRAGVIRRSSASDTESARSVHEGGEGDGGWLIPTAKAVWALTLAYEKRGKLRHTCRAKKEGMLVLCDRFPQSQVTGFSDGPLLSHWREHRRKLFRYFASWELDSYKLFEKYPPDIVIKLNVTPEVACQRKQDMSLEEVSRRVNVVKNLRYPPETVIVEINADAPWPSVLLDVKRAIWEKI